MADTNIIPGNLIVQGNLSVFGTAPTVNRSSLVQDSSQRYKIEPWHWRVWDAMQTLLPGTSAADDLAIIGGTFATGSPSIQTSDMKALGSVTRYARTTFTLPPEYVTGQAVTIRVHAGMLTTVADTTATIDVACYRSDDEAGIGSDLCATAAQSCNSLTLADKDFTITPSSLAPGDTLDIRIASAVNDAATATAVIGVVGAVTVLLPIKG